MFAITYEEYNKTFILINSADGRAHIYETYKEAERDLNLIKHMVEHKLEVKKLEVFYSKCL